MNSIHEFKVKDARDKDYDLSQHKGKVVLVVNVASKCGFTPQYKGLEAVYREFKDQGFVILGFPSNQFGSQEPGNNDQIQEFCELNYGVSFPVLGKVDVNGSAATPLYGFLKEKAPGLLGTEAIKWNFTKFLVTGSQAGILTDDDHISANIIDVTPIRVQQALEKNKVVVLAGFQGVSQKTKEITTLGRGGSDITAVAMAFALNAARCEILKDVDSIFTADPNSTPNAKPIRNLNADQLYEMTYWGAKVLNYKSVEKFHSPNNPNTPKPELYIGPAHKQTQSGTMVHNAFDKSKYSFFEAGVNSEVLSINTLSECWLVSSTEFDVKLKESQQSLSTSSKTLPFNATQILKNVDTGKWITAPTEILNQLRSNIDIKENLCVITLTVTEKSNLTKVKTEIQNQLNGIKHIFESNYSLHLFCVPENRKNLVEKIHAIYFK